MNSQSAWVTASASLLHTAPIPSRWHGVVQGCDAGLCVRTSRSCSLAQGVGVFLRRASCALCQACLSPNPLFKTRVCFWAVRMDFLEVQSLLKMSWTLDSHQTLPDDVLATTYSRLSSGASSHQCDSVMTTMAPLWGPQALTAALPQECRVLQLGLRKGEHRGGQEGHC